MYYCNRSDVPFRNESTEVAWLQKHQIAESRKRSSQSLLTFQTDTPWDFVFWFYWVFNKNIQNLLKWKKLGLCKNFQKNIKRWQYVLHIIFTADVCVCVVCVCMCLYSFTLVASSDCNNIRDILEMYGSTILCCEYCWVLLASSFISVSKSIIIHVQRRNSNTLANCRDNDMIYWQPAKKWYILIWDISQLRTKVVKWRKYTKDKEGALI